MTEVPEDILRTATEVAEVWFHEEWEPENYIQQDLVEAIARAILMERNKAGGAAATYFHGVLLLVHPDMPPHVWDGEKMEKVEPTTANLIRASKP